MQELSKSLSLCLYVFLALGSTQLLLAQQGMGRGGFGGGRGGGGSRSQAVELLAKFDQDANGWLNAQERLAARVYLGKAPQTRSSNTDTRESQQSVTLNPRLTPADVKWYSTEPLYDLQTLRTLFLEFENSDWEAELEDFHNTDIDVAAQLIVDGRTYKDVGVRFRGNSSYSSVSRGWKRSLNLSIDFAHKEQRLYGYRTLNLLNSNTDPTFVRTILYQEIARDYLPAFKANYVRVVINGESWGIYINIEQFNTDFIQELFHTRDGARWKVPQMRSNGGLTYLGDSPQAYKNTYDIKSKDDPESWEALVHLCKVLNQTPEDRLEDAISPILDIDETLKFLALDRALVNGDGYWSRASDYVIYLDTNGRFHILPFDTNEGLRSTGGQGGFGRGVASSSDGQISQLSALPSSGSYNRTPLYRLLAVPALRDRYLDYVRDIAEKWLDWSKIFQLAEKYQALIAADVESDQRKLYSTLYFYTDVILDIGQSSGTCLKTFVEQRRDYLLQESTENDAGKILREYISLTKSQSSSEE